MTKRCRDTNYYVSGSKVRSGSAWVIDPVSKEELHVVSGRSPVGPGRIHVGELVAGTRVYTGEGVSALFDPQRLYGRRGRSGPRTLSGAEEKIVVRRSSKVSRLLRHGATEMNLVMDEAGWVQRSEVTRVLGCDDSEIDEVLLHNDKGRLEAFGDRVRAVQGHSLDGAPVTREALEASWERISPEGMLYHATRAQNVDSISESGISAQGRTHVHLALTRESAWTTSGRGEALVVVDAAVLAGLGVGIFRAPNGVVLVREVPLEAIVETLVSGG